MGINPKAGEKELINDIRRTYFEAEKTIIKKIANYVKGGKDIPNWYSRKLAQLDDLSGEVRSEIIGDLVDTNEDIKKGIERAYKKGQKSAVQDLSVGGRNVAVSGTFGDTDQRAVKKLSQALTNKLGSTHLRIVRQTEDAYRRIVGEASRQVLGAGKGRVQAAQQAINEFANQGITPFVDKSGRTWNLASYAEMATRSTAGQAAIEGQIGRMKDNDHDLAIVGTSGESCPLCAPWEGRVVSISGDSDKYPALDTAIAEGLFHPNCTHSLTAYIPGVTKAEEAEYNPEAYENRQQQRYNERGIRKWKKRKAGAITEKEKAKAQSKISEWQAKQREFLEKTDRRRKYGREQVGKRG